MKKVVLGLLVLGQLGMAKDWYLFSSLNTERGCKKIEKGRTPYKDYQNFKKFQTVEIQEKDKNTIFMKTEMSGFETYLFYFTSLTDCENASKKILR